MTLTQADFSGLKNAVANQGTAKVAQANVGYERAVKASNLAKTAVSAYSSVAKAVELQEAGQKSGLTNELEEKSKVFNQLLDTSISNGNTYIGDDGNIVYGEDVTDYMTHWMDDINAREDVSKRVKKWANDYLTNVGNTLNEKVLLKAAQNGAAVANLNDSEVLNNALNSAIASRDVSVLNTAIDGLSVDNQTKQALKVQYGADFQIGAIKETVHQIATTEGTDKAIAYIEGGSYGNGISISLSRDQKDSLAAYARSTESTTLSDLGNSAARNTQTSRKNGMTYTDIYNASTDESLSATNQQAIYDGIAKVQAQECADWWGQFSGELSYASKERLEEIKTELEENKDMFTRECEDLYKSYETTIDKCIKASEDTTAKANTAVAKAVGETYYNQWDAGKISGQYAIDCIYSYAETVGDNQAAFSACDEFVNKIIINKVPSIHKESVQRFWDGFNSDWLSRIDVKKLSDMNDEQRDAYQDAYIWAEGALADVFRDCANLTASELSEKMKGIKNTFIAKYLDVNALITGADETASRNKSAQELLTSFAGSTPVYFDQSRGNGGEEVWISEEARANFENVAAYYKDELNEMGFNVTGYSLLRYGNNVEAIPVFKTASGDNITIDPATNEVHKVTIIQDKWSLSENPVKPTEKGVQEVPAGSSASNVTKHGKSVDSKKYQAKTTEKASEGYYGPRTADSESRNLQSKINSLTLAQKYQYQALVNKGDSPEEAYKKVVGGNK